VRILCSTGAVTRHPTRGDHRLVADARELPCDGFELSIYPNWVDDAARVADEIAAFGLPIETAHAEKSVGARLSEGDRRAVDRLEGSVRIAADAGARLLVLHLWELPLGDRQLERNLDLLPACADVAEAAGLTLGVETIPCSVGSPLANVARAIDREPRCVAVLDTEFLAHHGELDDALASGLPVGHVHVKDYGGEFRQGDPRTRYLLPGEGSLDLDGFLTALAAQGYDGAATLEASAVDPDGALDRGRLAEIAGALARLRAATHTRSEEGRGVATHIRADASGRPAARNEGETGRSGRTSRPETPADRG
jgi:sugar phosphate isomerase/epimerase